MVSWCFWLRGVAKWRPLCESRVDRRPLRLGRSHAKARRRKESARHANFLVSSRAFLWRLRSKFCVECSPSGVAGTHSSTMFQRRTFSKKGNEGPPRPSGQRLRSGQGYSQPYNPSQHDPFPYREVLPATHPRDRPGIAADRAVHPADGRRSTLPGGAPLEPHPRSFRWTCEHMSRANSSEIFGQRQVRVARGLKSSVFAQRLFSDAGSSV
jgi:hypothetical protein